MIKNSILSQALLTAVDKGYTCDKEGNCFGPSGRARTLSVSKTGYYYFSVKVASAVQHVKAHALVAYTKFGDAIFGDNIHIRHLDGNQLNNNWNNIEIGSPSENFLDKPEHERIEHARIAAKMRRALSDEQVLALRKESQSGFSLRDISRKYGISKSTASYIVSGRTYKHLL